jgi:hypothetical protein
LRGGDYFRRLRWHYGRSAVRLVSEGRGNSILPRRRQALQVVREVCGNSIAAAPSAVGAVSVRGPREFRRQSSGFYDLAGFRQNYAARGEVLKVQQFTEFFIDWGACSG